MTLSRSFWIRALVTVAVLALILRKIDGGETLRAIGRLDLWTLALVGGLLVIDRAVMVTRWLVLLRAAGQPISTKSATWIYLVSSFVGSFLPAGVGADLARAYTLTQRTSQGGAAIASVAADRLLGLISILLVGLVGAAFWRRGADGQAVLMSGAALGVVASVAFLWADSWVRALMPPALAERRIGIRALRYADALAAYRGHRGAVALVLALSVGVQLLRIFQAYVLGQGIGIDVPFGYYLLFMPVGLIALLLPISISGFGAPQALMVWLLTPVGVPESEALALTTLIVLSGIATNVPGAILYLRQKKS
ncbi:MAG TPA: lysylphosphatidylglycerol synthase transmembrane domain-containing protein [Vicinamibacterales bacterium]